MISPGLAVITGASSGIGAEFARQLHARGWNLLLVARRKERLAQLTDQLNQVRATSAEFYCCDLSTDSPQSGESVLPISDLLELLRSRPVDLLVNNAGIGSFGLFEKIPWQREQEIVRLNVEAPLRLAHAVLPGMKSRARGAIVTVSSIAAFQPLPYMSTYAASKAFELHHSIALGEELRGSGVRVLTLCPGPTNTEFAGVARVPGEFSGVGRDGVEMVVARALRALDSRRLWVITGLRSTVLAWISRLVPARFSTRISAWMLRGALAHSKFK